MSEPSGSWRVGGTAPGSAQLTPLSPPAGGGLGRRWMGTLGHPEAGLGEVAAPRHARKAISCRLCRKPLL